MSLLVNQPSKICFRKPVFVRSSPILSNGFSSSLLQTPPCMILYSEPCGADLGKLVIWNVNEPSKTHLEKKVPLELVDDDDDPDPMGTIGSSHGWVGTLKDGRVILHDDLNPYASDTDPQRIPLPHLVTLPHCQTQIVTNVSISSSSPKDEDCVVAFKFLGPQLSFCRPAQSNSEWINIRIENPYFFSSRVMFFKRNDMFRLVGSGGHIIGSWDVGTQKKKPKIHKLRFRNLPKLTKLLHSCCKSEHLVESQSTGEIFLIKWYKNTVKIINSIAKMKTKAMMVFKLDKEGNTVYTRDIGNLCIFLSKSEPFCVPASSFPGLRSNHIYFFDFDEVGYVHLPSTFIKSAVFSSSSIPGAPYYIPPKNID